MLPITMAAAGEQPLTDNQKRLVEEIYSRLDTWEQECRDRHDAARTAREIARLRDPLQDSPAMWEEDPEAKPTLQLQTLKSTINNCVADQMLNLPEAKLLPETPAQQEAVEDLQDLVHHTIYEVNQFEQLHRRRSEDLYITGTAITQVVWDPDMSFGKGDIALIRWPIEAFLWDKQADNLQDARALFKLSWHPLSWYVEHYPDEAEYINAENGQYQDMGLSPEQMALNSGDEPRAMLLEYWYRAYDAKKHRYTINVAYCAGGALLYHKKDIYNHGMYPFVVDVHSTIEGSLVGEGLVDELAPMMRYINRYARYIDTNLRMSSKGRLLTRRNANIDRKALADWSQDIIEGDSVVQGEDWNWMQHAPFNGMISNQLLQFQSDLKQDAGANQFTRGETTGGIVSGKAITALQSAGGKIQQLHTGTLNTGYKQMVLQVLWLMSQFYDKDRITMVTGKTGDMRQVTMAADRFFGKKGKEITPPPYTVQVEITSRDPVRIESQNQMYLQAYTMAAQAQQFFPLSALFTIMNVEGKDRILPVLRANESYMQQMQQMQQQMQQMQQQLDQTTKERDSLKMTATRMTSALTGAGRGFTPQAQGTKAAQAGGGPFTRGAMASQARMDIENMPEEAG